MYDFNGGCKIFSFLSYHKLSKLAFSCLSDFYDDWLERMIDLKSGFHYRFIINVCLKGFHFLNEILCTSSSRELLKFKVLGSKIFNSKKEEKRAIFSSWWMLSADQIFPKINVISNFSFSILPMIKYRFWSLSDAGQHQLQKGKPLWSTHPFVLSLLAPCAEMLGLLFFLKTTNINIILCNVKNPITYMICMMLRCLKIKRRHKCRSK